jgi:hypothetical protein
MNVFGQIGLSDSASNGRLPGDTFTQDAEFTIAFLGDEAGRSVTTGSLMHFGGWAGWPAWLREGSSLNGSGPLPQRLTVADDLCSRTCWIMGSWSFSSIASHET